MVPKTDFHPRDYQQEIIEESCKYFEKNDKGLLLLMCGMGKTLTSLWIAQKLNFSKIVIGVPNHQLLNQWKEKIAILFPDYPILLVSGAIRKIDMIEFLSLYGKNCIIITTYASSYKLNKTCNHIKYKFDLKILDEAHHLTSIDSDLESESKKYIQMLGVPSTKQLALTATLKNIENHNAQQDIISNDSVDYFGEIIDRKCLLWAIKKNIICDYIIQTIMTNEEELQEHLKNLNITDENDKRLFLSAYIALKSLFKKNSHHLLIYTNNKRNSIKIIYYITRLLEDNYFTMPELFYGIYHSDMNSTDRDKVLSNFGSSKYGIISCVYCLGEGWDFPLLDGVVFAENMTSNIRIVQSALRGSRKNINEPNKISKIIVPILNSLDDDSSDFRKVSEIVHQMGQEDVMVSQKIKIIRTKIERENLRINVPKLNREDRDLGEYDEELTELLKLRTVKRIGSTISFEKARRIVRSKKLNYITEYNELCERDNRIPRRSGKFF